MKQLLYICFLVCYQISVSQDVSLDWAKQISGNDPKSITSVVTDEQGNIYAAGYFFGTADFNPGINTYYMTTSPAGSGSGSGFVVKFDDDGDFVWARQLSRGNLAIDGQGDLLLVGNNSLVKMDPNSNIIWEKNIGGIIKSFSLDNNNIVCTGEFQNTADFDPSSAEYFMTATNYQNIFILKLDSTGDFIWARQIKSFGDASDIVTDEFGSIYSGGSFSGTADFDPGSDEFILNSDNGGGFILKLDSTGKFQWVHQTENANRSLALGNNCDIVTSAYDELTKLDLSGHVIWNKKFRSSLLTIDPYGNIYAAGSFSNSIDIDPGPDEHFIHSNGYKDAFLALFNPNGDFINAISIGGLVNDYIQTVYLDKYNNIYVGGDFFATIDFDPGPGSKSLTSDGLNDAFLAKYKFDFYLDENYLLLPVKILPNPTQGEFTVLVNECCESVYVEVCDMAGRLIRKKLIDYPNSIQINLSGEPTGTYIIKLSKENRVIGAEQVVKH